MANDRCVSCGGPRNHFVDGKPRPKCASCNDKSSGVDRVRPPGTGPTMYRSSREPAAMSKDAVELLGRIDEMSEDERYMWANETLEGIRATVLRTGSATEGQLRACGNIEGAGTRGRRY